MFSCEDHLSLILRNNRRHAKTAPHLFNGAQNKPDRSGSTELPRRREVKMKTNCRKALATSVLALTLVPAAFADDGIIHTDRTQPAPTANGIIHTDEVSNIEVTDALTQIGLDVLQGLLTRF
jgi:hypothetical protein